MDRRDGWLGYVAVGLGALALLVALLGSGGAPRVEITVPSSSSGQVPSSTSGAIWVNSGASSATSRWPRLSSSSASSLLPAPDSPVMSTPME